MPRNCTICRSPKRERIEAALVDAREPDAKIARRLRVSPDAISRHRPHMHAKVAAVLREDGVNLVTRTTEMRARVAEVFAVLDRVKDGELSPLIALDSGYLEMKLKAVDRLAKITDAEFGTKSKVEVSEAVRKLTPEQVAVELEQALAEIRRRTK